MVTFSDDFDRADQDLDNVNSWQTIGENDATTGVLEIKSRFVTNTLAGVAGYAAQEAAATAPDTTDQKVAAYVTSGEEGASTYARIGVGGETVPGSQEWDDRGRMAFVELAYRSDGERVLAIKHKVGAATAETTLATLTMVAAGTVVQEGYYGQLLDDGALNSLQHLRFIVTAHEWGLQLAAYVNNDDDDHPTLEARLQSDWDVGAGFTETYGYWWFELSGASAETVVLTQFAAEDYTIADRVVVEKKPYWPKVSEVIERVRRRFGQTADINFDDFTLIEMAADALEEIVLQMGDEPFFLIIQETFTITVDAEGFATLDAKIERPLYIERIGDKRPQSWSLEYLDSAGNVVVRLNVAQETSNTSFYVKYIQRFVRPAFPDDVLPIPKRHIMAVVYAVCRELAGEQERSPQLEATFERRYQERLLSMKREQSRYWRQGRHRLRPRRRATAEPFSHPNPKYRRF